MTEIEIASQWLLKAKNDLLNADSNLKSEIPRKKRKKSVSDCPSPKYAGVLE